VEGDKFLSQKGDEKFTHFIKKGDLLVNKMVKKKSGGTFNFRLGQSL
jgi:hypothetical protein